MLRRNEGQKMRIKTVFGLEIGYIDVMFERTQETPCHLSTQGSPPDGTQPGRRGEPNAIYKLFIA